jgi:hypothetical protein
MEYINHPLSLMVCHWGFRVSARCAQTLQATRQETKNGAAQDVEGFSQSYGLLIKTQALGKTNVATLSGLADLWIFRKRKSK